METKQIKLIRLPTAVLGVDHVRDGKQLFAACMDGVYSVDAEGVGFEKIAEHDSYVSSVCWHAPAKTLITAGYDGNIKWIDVAGKQTVRTVKAHDFWSWDMALSADGSTIASVTGQYLPGGYKYEPAAEKEPCVKVFKTKNGELLQAFSHVPSVQSVAISPDSRLVAAGNLMGEIRVWDLNTGERVSTASTNAFTSWGVIKSHCYIGGIYAMQFSSADRLLVTGMGPMRDPMAGNGKQRWQEYDRSAPQAKLIRDSKDEQTGEGLMESLAVHPSKEFFLIGGRLRGGAWNVGFFATDEGNLIHSLKTDCRITKAVFNEAGDRLFLAGTQGQPNPKRKDGGYFGRIFIYDVDS